MTGCDDGQYAVVLLVAHAYEVTAKDEKEALREAIRQMHEGQPAKAAWLADNEVTTYGNERDGKERDTEGVSEAV